MDNYLIKHTTGTSGGVVFLGLLASQILASGVAGPQFDAMNQGLIIKPYKTTAHQRSFDQVSNFFSGEFNDGTLHFSERIHAKGVSIVQMVRQIIETGVDFFRIVELPRKRPHIVLSDRVGDGLDA